MNFSSAIKLASIATERNLSSTLRTTLDRSRSTRMDWTSSTDITVLASAHNARNKTRATIVETAVDAGFICSIYRCPHSVDDCICFTRSSKIHMQNTYIFGTVKHQLPSFFLSFLFDCKNQFMSNIVWTTPGRGFSSFIYLHTLPDWLKLKTWGSAVCDWLVVVKSLR